jgi:spermidine/putrescine-binding protein
LLTGGDAVLAQTYASTPARLILAGQPFRRVVPREGSLSFVYNFAIVKGAPNRDAAYRFLDAMLGTPGVAAVQVRRTTGRVYWLHNQLRWRFSVARR